MEVITTFFYSKVEEDIYIIQPIGPEDGSWGIWKLEKKLYGLKQAPQIWTKKVQKFLKKYGYILFDSDSSIYHRLDSKRDQQIVIAFYNDDDLITSPSTTKIVYAKSILKSNFRMVELGLWTYY